MNVPVLADAGSDRLANGNAEIECENRRKQNAAANAGQLKNVFSFDALSVDAAHDTDANGLPDWWEIYYFGHIGVDPSGMVTGRSNTISAAAPAGKTMSSPRLNRTLPKPKPAPIKAPLPARKSP